VRIVLDTNVWVSALAFPDGACDQLLRRLLRHHAVELFASSFILKEFERVLLKKLDFSYEETKSACRILRRLVTFVEPAELVKVVKEKDADNRILECALAAKAELLVTGDTKHLLPLKSFRGIAIKSPREVLDHLK
jgi:putative PIN family toxin of toxin-antitoxin system